MIIIIVIEVVALLTTIDKKKIVQGFTRNDYAFLNVLENFITAELAGGGREKSRYHLNAQHADATKEKLFSRKIIITARGSRDNEKKKKFICLEYENILVVYTRGKNR